MNYVTALVQLPLVRETRKEKVLSPDDVARICADLSDLAQESFHVLLNTRMRRFCRMSLKQSLSPVEIG